MAWNTTPQVEKFFGALLPATRYWLGASRASMDTDYTLTDGMPIMQASDGSTHRLHDACNALASLVATQETKQSKINRQQPG
jgi:hypothetical protein